MSTTRLEAGQALHGFLITAVTPLPEINTTLYQLRHEATGAHMVHLATADSNNLFAVAFRTPPADSTGVAHILEHTVLCGSHRYPVRDPFFSMLKRSLNTFMNAMTSSDWTAYPFSSQNTRDFYNLLGIYLDAAFFPLLRERDFSQEGHRLEFADPENLDSALQFKGVVYNEMKGAMASAPSLLSRRLAKALYPTTTYGHNSGGEPECIPDLSWEELKTFHARYYHPSNAYFFTYGNLPLEEHLRVIQEQALADFGRREVVSEVPPEERFDAPRRVTDSYPLDPGESIEGKTFVQVGWLTGEITDSFERLAMNLLATLLLGNPAAPLYKALLDSRLGGNLAPGTGYHDENRTTYFAAGLQGSAPERAEAIEKLILDTLEEVARSGFSKERIEGAIHRLEFGHREVSGDHYPYPLALLMRILGPWLHGDDPVSPLRLEENLARLRREIAAGPFFEELIRKNLLANPHRVTLTLCPDTRLGQQQEAATAKRLEEVGAKLSAPEKERIVLQARQLQRAQEAAEDLSCLPTLTRDDIPLEEIPVPGVFGSEAGCQVQWFDQPTNGIDYFIAHLPADDLPAELLPYLPVFAALLTQVGAAGQSYLQLAERMEAGTGGIQAATAILDAPGSLERFEGLLEIKGKALVRNQQQLFAILSDLFAAPDFTDMERIRTVIGQMKTALENSVPGSGHSYAARAAGGRLTPGGRRRELWSGLALIRLVKQLAELPLAKLGEVAERLQAIAGHLLTGSRISTAVTGETHSFDAVRPALGDFLAGLAAGTAATPGKLEPFASEAARMGFATSVPVAYVSRVFRTVPFTHPDAAPLMVLAKLLRAGFLHREIREKGGAYGGLAAYDPEAGLFSLLSYRDPHLARTLRVYDEATEWAVAGRFQEEEITEAVLAVFSDLDRPLSPGSKGYREFANSRQGLNLAMRNELRRQALAVDGRQLAVLAENYLGQGREASAVSVIAGEEALQKANRELGAEELQIERI